MRNDRRLLEGAVGGGSTGINCDAGSRTYIMQHLSKRARHMPARLSLKTDINANAANRLGVKRINRGFGFAVSYRRCPTLPTNSLFGISVRPSRFCLAVGRRSVAIASDLLLKLLI